MRMSLLLPVLGAAIALASPIRPRHLEKRARWWKSLANVGCIFLPQVLNNDRLELFNFDICERTAKDLIPLLEGPAATPATVTLQPGTVLSVSSDGKQQLTGPGTEKSDTENDDDADDKTPSVVVPTLEDDDDDGDDDDDDDDKTTDSSDANYASTVGNRERWRQLLSQTRSVRADTASSTDNKAFTISEKPNIAVKAVAMAPSPAANSAAKQA